jgi:heme/copper-type cytochrome/quinol oxidase subunit 1
LDLDSRSYYIVATIIIGIPTGIKIFNWLLRIWRRNFYYNLLNLWIFGFIFIFTIGGLTGLILSNFIIDIHLHDTYYVVAHFHYVLSMGAVFTLFIGFNLWLRIIIKISNSNFLGILIYLIFFFRVNLTFFPIHFLGIIGMPRKYLIYEKEYLIYNVFSSFGSRLTVFRIFIIIFLIWLIIFNFNNLLINNSHNLRSIESSDFFKNHRNIEYSIIFL